MFFRLAGYLMEEMASPAFPAAAASVSFLRGIKEVQLLEIRFIGARRSDCFENESNCFRTMGASQRSFAGSKRSFVPRPKLKGLGTRAIAMESVLRGWACHGKATTA